MKKLKIFLKNFGSLAPLISFQRSKKSTRKNQKGFIVADFIFSFVLCLGVGIFIFGLTFSLATIEVAQYIVWSAARSYASGNETEAAARAAAQTKFRNLSEQFPLLTGSAGSPWFVLDDFAAQDFKSDPRFTEFVPDASDRNNLDLATEPRQPWTGASAQLYLKLFSSMRVPFLGKVSDNPDSSEFKFRLFAFIIRNPSAEECRAFFDMRFTEGIQRLDTFLSPTGPAASVVPGKYYPPEDNGC